MAVLKPVTFLRFLVFYTLGSSAFMAPAFGLGYLTTFLTEWGWDISSALLAGYFSYQIAADIFWSRDFIAAKAAISPGEHVPPIIPDHKRAIPYAAAALGAAFGWLLGSYTLQYSFLVVYAVFCLLNFAFEKWRTSKIAKHGIPFGHAAN